MSCGSCLGRSKVIFKKKIKSEHTTNISAHNATEVCYIDISDGKFDIEASTIIFKGRC